jgi:transcription initiation factor TFIIE subunit beta
MSSYLEKQSSAFKGTLASAATKISNPSTLKAAALAPPSPSPSAASDSTTPTAKRKRDAPPEVPYSQPQLTGYGLEVKTQMTFAVDKLKKERKPMSLIDLINHLSVQSHPEEHKKALAEGLRRHPRVEWKPDPKLTEQTWLSGTFAHRPLIPGVHDSTTLLAYLQRKTDASGLSVKDLKDGWPECEETLTNLERQHKILVVRTKKDNLPRYVWPNDPSLFHAVQPEFQAMWHRVPIPSIADMHRKLVSVGQKPTSEDPHKIELVSGNKAKVQKRRVGNRASKATNQHMTHLLQDYSKFRR